MLVALVELLKVEGALVVLVERGFVVLVEVALVELLRGAVVVLVEVALVELLKVEGALVVLVLLVELRLVEVALVALVAGRVASAFVVLDGFSIGGCSVELVALRRRVVVLSMTAVSPRERARGWVVSFK